MREECTLTSSKYGPFEFRHTMHNISEEFRQEFGEGIQIRRKKLESEEYTDADILHYPGGEYTSELNCVDSKIHYYFSLFIRIT